MTESFWELLAARERPERTVRLPVGDSAVEVRLRALLPAEWDALLEASPAVDGQPGSVDVGAMWPALLAASVVAPDGSPPRDPAWWENLVKQGLLVSGERDALVDTAWTLNQPRTVADLGKG